MLSLINFFVEAQLHIKHSLRLWFLAGHDDCDIESFNLIYSWPDSNTAPEKIVFHVTDNDGAVASVEINIDVRNMKPSVGIGSPSDYNPISGDLVILTGNGTTIHGT